MASTESIQRASAKPAVVAYVMRHCGQAEPAGLSAKDMRLAVEQREADERAARARTQRAMGCVPMRR